ncbi:transposase family protein [Escherichia coli MP021017.9]|nr:transposase family protein [Escherichia coli MP021017.9]EMU80793.1 transposase family protein [Escherichia coli MP021017.6]EMU95296.1 transposase family protein [Escherichia coli MP021017.3]EMU98390.1 transposase family protein [Escherichia coli MP021017.2]EMV00311.1 transposase family protein [Escherichia coli MP021017.4]EMV24648.1 transposase family protein [Escherichia coli MP021017.12]EMX38865.1 transposase family protein [Escherichia coli MP021017.1]ENA14922.1 transposase family prot
MDKPTDWRSGTRRIFSNEFKLHMVELASKPNANVAQLAREHGVDVTNGAIMIHTQRLKSDPGGNLLS